MIFLMIRIGLLRNIYYSRQFKCSGNHILFTVGIWQGRVGLYIHPIDVWEASEGTESYHFSKKSIKTDRDFRVEPVYD